MGADYGPAHGSVRFVRDSCDGESLLCARGNYGAGFSLLLDQGDRIVVVITLHESEPDSEHYVGFYRDEHEGCKSIEDVLSVDASSPLRLLSSEY